MPLVKDCLYSTSSIYHLSITRRCSTSSKGTESSYIIDCLVSLSQPVMAFLELALLRSKAAASLLRSHLKHVIRWMTLLGISQGRHMLVQVNLKNSIRLLSD